MTRQERGLDPFMPGRQVNPDPGHVGLPLQADDAYVARAVTWDDPPTKEGYRQGKCGSCGGACWLPRSGVAYWSRMPIVCSSCTR